MSRVVHPSRIRPSQPRFHPDGTGGRCWPLPLIGAVILLLFGVAVPSGVFAAEEDVPISLEGIVRSHEGQPISGARVLAAGEAQDAPWVEPVETKTAEDGRFTLEAPGAPPYAVRVVSSGCADARVLGVDGEEPLEVELRAERIARGSVYDVRTGEPLAGARVFPAQTALGGNVSPERARELLPSATSDETGRFALGRLPAGIAGLWVEAAGYASRKIEVPTVDPDVEESAAEAVHAYLVPGLAIRGSLRDSAGEPLSGARIRVRPDRLLATVGDFSAWSGDVAAGARTRADGSFELPGVPKASAYVLFAAKEGFARRRWVDLRPGPGGDIEGLELQLTRGGGVRARLVDPDGKPVEAEVTVVARYRDADPDSDRMPFTVPLDAEREDDAPGQVAARHLPLGDAEITFQPDGYAEAVVDGVEVRAGEVRDLGERLVQEGPGIRGRVLDPEGEPLAGARVEARGFSGFGLDREDTETREDGSFRLGGLDQETSYDLTVNAEGFGPESRQEVEPGVEPLEFRLEPAASLRGKVVAAGTGSPVPSYRLQIEPGSSGDGGLDPQSLMRRLLADREEISRPDGVFSLDDLAAGTYSLRLRAHGFVPRVVDGVELVQGEQKDLGQVELDPGMTIRGTVTDDETGRPVPGATISTEAAGPLAFARRQMEGAGELGVTAPDGTFEVSGMASGTTTLVVDHPRYAKAKQTVELDPATPPAPLSVALTTGGTVEGVVLGDDGRPLGGARVMAMSGFAPDPKQQTTTDELGHYRLEHLQPGTVRVIVTKIDTTGERTDMASVMSGMKMETVEIEDGKTTVLSFPTPEGGIRVSGRLLDADEQPMKAVMMWFPDEAGRIGAGSLASTVSSEEGSYSVQLPRAGRYRVVAQVFGDDPGAQEAFFLEAAVEDRPTVQLELMIPDTAITGLVRDAKTGEPLDGAQVFARPKQGELPMGGTTTTGSDGSFALEGLAPGEYDLVFRRPGYGMEVLAELDVDQGDELEDRDVMLEEAIPVELVAVAAGGRPLPGAWAMTVSKEGVGGQQLGLTDEDGRMTIDVLPPGDHEIGVWASGYAPKVASLSVPPLEEGPRRVVLQSGVPSVVVVHGASGEPLEDAALQVRTEGGADLTSMLQFATSGRGGALTTEADGRIELPRLEPGDYRITVSLGELETTDEVTLREGEENVAEIDLR